MNTFGRIVHYFMPDKSVCPDKEIRQKLRLMISFMVITNIMVLSYSFVNYSVGNTLGAIGNAISTVVMLAALTHTKSKGNYLFAGNMFLACGVLTINMGILTSGVAQSPSMMWLVVIPIGASFALNIQAGKRWWIVVVLNAIALVSFSVTHPPTRIYNLKHYIFLAFVLTTVTSLLLFFSSRFQTMKDEAMALVEERNKTIRRIVENVKSGFLVIDEKLVVQVGHSVSCLELFDRDEIAGLSFSSLLTNDSRMREHLDCVWEQVFADILPTELSLEQAPATFLMNGTHLGVTGAPLREANGKISAILFTVNDVTDQIVAEAANKRNARIIFILKHKDVFRNFVEDTKLNLQAISNYVTNQNFPEALKLLHALKGNSSSLALGNLSKLIHEIEDTHTVTFEDLVKLNWEFKTFLDDCENITDIDFANEQKDVRSISRDAIVDLKKTILTTSTIREAKSIVANWTDSACQVKVRQQLRHFATLVENTGRECNKPTQLHLTGDDVAIDPDLLQPILLHFPSVFRNAIFHGIEDVWERDGKPKEGQITLHTKLRNDMLVIEISDDGRGIDIEKLKTRALEKSIVSSNELAQMNHQQSLQLVFRENLSTQEQANEVAGRGLGLAALRDAVVAIGGNIEVRSETGRGMTLAIAVPTASSAAKAA